LQYAPGFADCGLRETVPAEFAQAGADCGQGFGFQAIFGRIIAVFSPFFVMMWHGSGRKKSHNVEFFHECYRYLEINSLLHAVNWNFSRM
jgi:hypothetical protein